MHSLRTEAIIIKRKNFGEADRILTAITKGSGKIKIIAKGVRKISSKRSPHVELLNLSVLNLHLGKMMILTEAETLYHHAGLKNDLSRSGAAFYLCELVDGLIPENQENFQVFNLLKNTLLQLEVSNDPRLVVSSFERDLLTILGFWPKEQAFLENSDKFIEGIMEKKIKTKRIFDLT